MIKWTLLDRCYFIYLLPFVFTLLTLYPLHAQEVYSFVPLPSPLLKGDHTWWHAEAQKWYKKDDISSKRLQMRDMTRALKRSCYYCHTRNFKDYTQVKEISLQMMAISHQHQITCADCHQGHKGLTLVGSKSLLMWRYSVTQEKQCQDCHQAQAQFKKLKSSSSIDLSMMWSSLYEHAQKLQWDQALIDQIIGTQKQWQQKYSQTSTPHPQAQQKEQNALQKPTQKQKKTALEIPKSLTL